ncbi:hypothetical protein V1264_023581 [Littorina saxatilis]|uniref:Tetratricopeptide SHNi-TPR domain-containing protein n=1 Tax=Littorina saxatilis TaxID=31220 RepID=A0AAN9GBC4_9CAEN
MSSEVSEGPSTSGSPTKDKMDARLKATNLLAQGKRNMVCQEIPTAVQQFQDACQLLSGAYGEMAKECADAYFQYGSALLELARMEQGVLGNALDGVDVDAEDDAEPNNKEQFEPVDKIGDGAGKTDKGDEKKDTEDGEEEEEEDDEEEGEEEGDEVESQEEGEKKEGEEDPEDISNLQLAWEVLELSKVIYSKEENKESQLKAAESSLKLGEVSLETEQYEQAINDLEACLKIQKEHLDSFDRAVAETHYQLGLAYHMNKQFEKAVENFKAAVNCLETKIEKLQIIVKEKPPKEQSQWVDPAESAEKEIKEIETILPEIKEKITDAVDESKSLDDFKTMAKEAMGSAFSAVAGSTTETGFGSGDGSSKSPVKSAEEKKALDISHLIRKKRKPDEEEKEVEKEVESKKAKQDESSGDAPMQNGHEKKEAEPEAMTTT